MLLIIHTGFTAIHERNYEPRRMPPYQTMTLEMSSLCREYIWRDLYRSHLDQVYLEILPRAKGIPKRSLFCLVVSSLPYNYPQYLYDQELNLAKFYSVWSSTVDDNAA